MLLNVALTAALMMGVSYTGFAMLARRQVKTLMQTMLLGNIILLLPVSDGFWLPSLIAGLFFALRAAELKLRQDGTMHLAEGLAARGLISLPLLILVGRSMLHPASSSLFAVLASLVAVIGVVDIKRYTKSALAIQLGQALGTLAALAAWLVLAHGLSDFGRMNAGLWLPLSLLLFILSASVECYATTYRLLGALLALGLVAKGLLEGQALSPLLALATGIALSLAGLRHREKIPFFTGHLCFLSGILFYCRYAVDAYQHAPWLSSIGLGLLVLLAASYLEKRQQAIARKMDGYWLELRNWT